MHRWIQGDLMGTNAINALFSFYLITSSHRLYFPLHLDSTRLSLFHLFSCSTPFLLLPLLSISSINPFIHLSWSALSPQRESKREFASGLFVSLTILPYLSLTPSLSFPPPSLSFILPHLSYPLPPSIHNSSWWGPVPQRHRFSPLLLPLHYQPFLHPSLTSLLLIFTSAILLHTQYLPVFSLNQVTTLLLISSSFPPFFFPLSILFYLSIQFDFLFSLLYACSPLL